jgi:flagellar hook-length control protein FliK
MPVTSIDAITAFTPPPRPADSPRASDADRPFAPALERAYKDERPKEAPPKPKDDPAKADDKAPPAEAKAVDSRHEESKKRSDDSPAATDAGAAHGEHDKHDQEHAKDSADISDEAAAAAAVAGDGKTAKEVNATLEKTLAVEQAKGVKGSAEEAKNGDQTGEAGAAANAKGKGKTGGGAGAEEALSAAQKAKDASAKAPTDEHQDSNDKKQAVAKNAKSANQLPNEVQPGQAADSQQKAVADLAAKAQQATDGEKAEATTAGASKAKKSKAAADDDAVSVNQPKSDDAKAPAPKPDQIAAAVEALTAPQAQTTKDSTKDDAPPQPKIDAVSSANASPRTSATLDRLAARALRTGDSEGSGGSQSVDKNRFVQRVEGAVRAAQQRDGRIQVRLSPPELGNLRIELAVQNGVMHAKLEAETPAARNALLDNLPALRDRLAQQDIRVEKFEVDIRRDTGGSAGGGQTFDRPSGQSDSGRQDSRPRTPTPRLNSAPAPRAAAATSAVSDAALDVRI